MRFPSLLLVLSALFLAACSQPPLQTVSPDQSAWLLPADRETRNEVTLTKGFDRQHVITSLGAPKSTRKLKEQNNVEILIYDRVVLGPTGAKLVNTMSGPVTVAKPILYNYHVEVILTDGLVSNVIVDRTISGEYERPFADR